MKRKLKGLEKKYTNNFSKSAEIFAKSQASSETISLLPRYMIEAIAFGGILLIILYLIGRSENFNEILPILSLFCWLSFNASITISIYLINKSYIYGPSLNKLDEDLGKLKSTDLIYEQEYLSLKKILL